MLEDATYAFLENLGNDAFARYAKIYADIERDFREEAASFGLDWESEKCAFTRAELERRAAALAQRGVVVENDCKSISTGWVSPSCVACRTGVGTETFLASTQCTRNCYFCFNPNQADYAYYLSHVHDMVAELQRRYDAGVRHADLAVTGGEPLLHRAELMAFWKGRAIFALRHVCGYTRVARDSTRSMHAHLPRRALMKSASA